MYYMYITILMHLIMCCILCLTQIDIHTFIYRGNGGGLGVGGGSGENLTEVFKKLRLLNIIEPEVHITNALRKL